MPTGRLRLEQPYRSAYFAGWFAGVFSFAAGVFFTVGNARDPALRVDPLIWLIPVMFLGAGIFTVLFDFIPVRSLRIDRTTGVIDLGGAFGQREQWSVGDVRTTGLRTWWNRPDTLVLQGDHRRVVLSTGPIPEVGEFLDELAAIQRRLGIELAERRAGEAVRVLGASQPAEGSSRRAERPTRKSHGYRLLIDGVVADVLVNVPPGDDGTPQEIVLDRRWSDLYLVPLAVSSVAAIPLTVGVVVLVRNSQVLSFFYFVVFAAVCCTLGVTLASAVRRVELDVVTGEVHATGMRKRWPAGSVADGITFGKRRSVGTSIGVGTERLVVASVATPAVLGFVDRLRAAAEQRGATAQVDLVRSAASTASSWRLVTDD